MRLFERLEDARSAEQVVWIGYDPAEDTSAKMAAYSIRSRSTNSGLRIIPIIRDELRAFGLFNRPLEPNGSTQFTITRFLVPQLMDFNGLGIFLDCDMLITRDIQELFGQFNPRFAIQCVKHNYIPQTQTKMGGKNQSFYPRKNWSSVVMYNCSHPSTKKLTTQVVEKSTPQFLHRFEWLEDKEIGGLPLEFNFLVGELEPLQHLPFNIHHTLGSPLFSASQDVPYADHFKSEFKALFGRDFGSQDIID